MWSYFSGNPRPYNLRNGKVLRIPPARSMHYGVNPLLFRGTLLWNSLPADVKEIGDINEFKNKIKALGILRCSCTGCR